METKNMRQIILTIVFLFMVQMSFGQVKSKTRQKAKSRVNHAKNKENTKPYIIPRVELEASMDQDSSNMNLTKSNDRVVKGSLNGSDENDNIEKQPQVNDLTENPDIQAKFPYNNGNYMNFIEANFEYPQRCLEKGISGEVILKFIVDTEGRVINIFAVEETKSCPEFTKESIRVIQKSPKWIPAFKNGKKVNSWVLLPIKLNLESDK